MYRTGPVYVWMVFYLGFYGFEDFCQFLLGLYQVNDGKETVTVQNFLGVWTYLVGKVGEDANDFLSLFTLQFTYTVVRLYHLGRFYKDCFTCGTLIVYDTFDLRFRVGMTGITSLPSRRVGVTSFLRCLHFVPSAIYYIRYARCCPLSLPVLCESEEVQGLRYLLSFRICQVSGRCAESVVESNYIL